MKWYQKLKKQSNKKKILSKNLLNRWLNSNKCLKIYTIIRKKIINSIIKQCIYKHNQTYKMKTKGILLYILFLFKLINFFLKKFKFKKSIREIDKHNISAFAERD